MTHVTLHEKLPRIVVLATILILVSWLLLNNHP
jgi:hypothetical protein